MGQHFDIIQVGAHHGYTLNDRYILDHIKIEDSAIFIEPIKELFDRLIENHKKYKPNNRYIFINKSCSDHCGILHLFLPDIEFFSKEVEPKYIQLGMPQWTDQLISVLPDHVKNHNLKIKTKQVTVDCVTMSSIIEEYDISSIGILQIDTEGHDYEVLRGMNFEKVKPKILIFENKHIEGTNSPLGKKYESIMTYLSGMGYVKTQEKDGDTYLELK